MYKKASLADNTEKPCKHTVTCNFLTFKTCISPRGHFVTSLRAAREQ